MPWRAGPCLCSICGYRWAGVQEVSEFETALECPACGHMAGHWEEDEEEETHE